MKKIISIFLSLVFVFSVSAGFVQTASAAYSGVCGDNLTWEFDEGSGVLTISGTGRMYDYDDSTDTPPWSNQLSNIKIISVDDGVVHIGNCAFLWAKNLERVILPDTITSLGEYAFAKCLRMHTIDIPQGMTSFGTGCFMLCRNLHVFNFPIGTKSVPAKMFKECGVLSRVLMADSIESIGEEAFMDCSSLNAVRIPWKAESIGDNAFAFCSSLTTVYLPSNLERINDDAFWRSNALNVVYYEGTEAEWNEKLDLGNSASDVFQNVTVKFNYNFGDDSCGDYVRWSFDDEAGILTVYGAGDMNDYLPGVVYTPWISFAESIKTVLIDEGVTNVGSFAFSHCKNLLKVYISSTVTEIKESAFNNCKSLRLLEISDGVVEIGSAAFKETGITSLILPDSVKTIGSYAFAFCKSLKTVILPDGLLTVKNEAFSYCNSLEYTEYEGLKYLGSEKNPYLALVKSSDPYMTSCEIHPSTKIISGAFQGRQALSAIDIPEGVRYIGGESFAFCSSLESIVLPGGVRCIDERSFSNCEKLKSITIPGSVSEIGNGAFYSCGALTDVYYDGPESDWKIIATDNEFGFNDNLLNAEIHFMKSRHEHSWDEFSQIILAATYTSAGEAEYTCLICGETKIEIVPKLISDFPGDIDGDGDITMKDVLSMRRYIAGLDEADDGMILLGDIDGDGDITIKDVLIERRKIAGLVTIPT